MAYILPIPLPEAYVRENKIVPANDFAHRHAAIAFDDRTGRRFLVSELFYNFYRYDNANDRDLSAYVVAILDREWTIERVVALEDLMRDMTHDASGSYIFNNTLAPPCVVDGGLAFSATEAPAIVLDRDLVARVATLGPGWLVATDDGTRIVVTGGDRVALVTASGERRDFGSLREDDDSYAARTEFTEYRGYAGPVAALDGDRIMLSLFTAMSRGGFLDHGAFRYILVDGTGAIVARLPLGEADSPYRPPGGGHHGCHPSRALDGWIVRSESAFHVFDRDGKRVLRLGLDEAYDGIAPLALLGVAPTGELVLVHRKHNTLVVTDPVREPSELAPALRVAAAAYKTEYARLKKSVPWEKHRFLGFEARSAAISSTPVPAKKAAKRAAAPPAPAPVEAATSDPAFAMALAPHDLETVAVYADSLIQRGDPLGDFISLHCRIPMATGDRRRLVGAANVMWRTHGPAWLARWNTPAKLFRGHRFAGLPTDASIESTKDLPAVEATLSRLPIQSIFISELGTKDIAKLAALPALRRVPYLGISGGSKRRLGGSLVEWLAAENLSRVEHLYLYPVDTTGPQLRALADGFPALRKLDMSKCGLTVEAVAALAETSTATRLEHLGLAYNPIGSAVMPFLAKLSNLRALNLHSCDIGDDVTAEPIPEMAVETLDVDDCERLGPTALAALVRAMPRLRDLELPGHTTAAHIDALLPIAPMLERLDLGFADVGASGRVAEHLLARCPKLASFVAYEATNVVGALLAHARLTSLTVGRVTDADVTALAASPGAGALLTLELDGDLSDDALVRVARSPHLQQLRDLDVTSTSITARGIGALLAMPNLEVLTVSNATIDDDAPLCARPADLVMFLFRCKITKAKRARIDAHWGNLVIF